MLKRKPPAQLELFVAGPLEQLVPDDHVLARIDRVLDLSWLHEEVADCYCANNGRPGIDPEVAVRLMLAGFLLGFAHNRRLMREARFQKIFRRTVSACVDAGITKGEVVHVDATLIRADAGWKSMVDRHAEAVASGNGDAAAEEGATDGEGRKAGKTDADASLATSRKGQRPEPCFKQHTAVDDENGVVLDVAVTTGEAGEGDMIEAQVDEVRSVTGHEIGTAAADAGYAFAKVYGGLERRGIDPLIPAKREPAKSRVPLRRFRYDAKRDIMKCPRGKVLRPGKPRKHGRFFHAKAKDCAAVGGLFEGAKRTGSCTGAISGGRRASTEKRRRSTDCAAPCGAASET